MKVCRTKTYTGRECSFTLQKQACRPFLVHNECSIVWVGFPYTYVHTNYTVRWSEMVVLDKQTPTQCPYIAIPLHNVLVHYYRSAASA